MIFCYRFTAVARCISYTLLIQSLKLYILKRPSLLYLHQTYNYHLTIKHLLKTDIFSSKYMRIRGESPAEKTILRIFLCRFKTFSCAAVEVKNEPILGFKEGSEERTELLKVNHTALWILNNQRAFYCVLLPSLGFTRAEG